MSRLALLFSGPMAVLLTFAGCSRSPEPYEQAEAAFHAGNYQEAIDHFNEAAKKSDNPAIYINRGSCYSYLGNLDAALKDYDSALESLKESGGADDPRLAYIYYNRGHACDRAKKFEQAIRDYEKAISVDGAYPDVKGNLAWILATCPDAKLRNPPQAVQLAQAECERTGWKNGDVIDTLAAAHAANGSFAKAIEMQEKAAGMTEDAKLKTECAKRLELYRSNQPYIDAQ